MLHGTSVFVGVGDMDYCCTLIRTCTGKYPFMARCNVSGSFIQRFTAQEVKLLRSGRLIGCELM